MGTERHLQVIREIGREHIELLLGSLEFILERVSTHPEWQFKELIDMLGFDRKQAWLNRRLDELREANSHRITNLHVTRSGTGSRGVDTHRPYPKGVPAYFTRFIASFMRCASKQRSQ